MRKPNTTHDETISSLYRSGLGCYAIGKQLNVNRHTVRAALIRLGIVRRSADSTSLVCDPIRNATIRKERARGVTLAEIGRAHGISRQRVYQLTQPAKVMLESSLAASQKQTND